MDIKMAVELYRRKSFAKQLLDQLIEDYKNYGITTLQEIELAQHEFDLWCAEVDRLQHPPAGILLV